MSLQTKVTHSVLVNSEELIGTAEYLTLYTRCHINRYRCNRISLCVSNKLPLK
jgi:hypothetical protein